MHPKDAPYAQAEEILREVLDVVTALRNGKFSAHMTEGFPGVGGQIAEALNAHLDMLAHFRNEHHRLMEEVGVTGRLGGQMEVDDTHGAWTDMLKEANVMGGNVTGQFRDGGNIVRAFLRGNFSARMTAECIHGEFREFREQFNQLADQFARQQSPENRSV